MTFAAAYEQLRGWSVDGQPCFEEEIYERIVRTVKESDILLERVLRSRSKEDIEHELDILRGRVPTPPGYVVDPGRAKKLMQELKRYA